MIRFFISFALFLSFITVSNAQAVRRYHQSLAIADASAIQIEANGNEVDVIKWAGNDILIEITVTTKLGSTTILNHLQKEGRYDLAAKVENGTAIVLNSNTKRQNIKVKGAEMDEHIKYQISVPENATVTNASATSSTEN
jgi:formamidopyrimidine-DNA glycosylase